jgi:hypothetical protein
MNQTLEFYTQRVNEAEAEANAATLDNVRERALRSAATWRGLADQARRVAAERVKADRYRAERAETERLSAGATPASA